MNRIMALAAGICTGMTIAIGVSMESGTAAAPVFIFAFCAFAAVDFTLIYEISLLKGMDAVRRKVVERIKVTKASLPPGSAHAARMDKECIGANDASLEVLRTVSRLCRLGSGVKAILSDRSIAVNAESPNETCGTAEILKIEEMLNATAKSKESMLARIQAYSTIKMFCSAVLPSFVLFGFTGYAIVGQGYDIPEVAAAMLLVIPTMYIIINALFVRGLFEIRR